MGKPFINLYRKQGEEGKVDFKDRDPSNQIPLWKNKSKDGKKEYFNLKTPDGESWIGFYNKYYEEEEEKQGDDWG